MPEIKIDITNKVASQIGTAVIVCGNDDYKITFTFDNEWGAYQEKTARFRFINAEGKKEYIDVLFSGSTCAVPILSNIDTVSVGVYAGDLQTTTGADIKCQRSILCGQGTKHEAPDPDVYNRILEACSQKLGSNGGTVTGDYYKDGNVFIHEGNLDKIDPHVQELLDAGQYINPNNLGLIDGHTQMVDNATGNAITVDSANAPLQQLKLYGKTTQDGTPTPTEPKELKSVGDSGSFEVGVYGKNLVKIKEEVFSTVTGKTFVKNGVTFTLNEDKSITVNGTPTVATQIVFCDLIIPKGKYIISGYPSNTAISGVEYFLRAGTDKGWYPRIGEVEVEYTQDTAGYMVISILANTTVNNLTFYPMFRRAEITDNTYEPCNKQSLTMPYTLRSVGDIKDEVDFNRGVLIQRCFYADNFVVNTNYFEDTNVYTCNPPNNLLRAGAGRCTHTALNSAQWNNTTHFYNEDKVVCVMLPKTLDSAEVISNLRVICLYETPIETPLTETELNAYRQLYTNKGNTTIISEAEASVTYYRNTENGQALGSVHAQINNDYLKLQQAIIALGGSTL